MKWCLKWKLFGLTTGLKRCYTNRDKFWGRKVTNGMKILKYHPPPFPNQPLPIFLLFFLPCHLPPINLIRQNLLWHQLHPVHSLELHLWIFWSSKDTMGSCGILYCLFFCAFVCIFTILFLIHKYVEWLKKLKYYFKSTLITIYVTLPSLAHEAA